MIIDNQVLTINESEYEKKIMKEKKNQTKLENFRQNSDLMPRDVSDYSPPQVYYIKNQNNFNIDELVKENNPVYTENIESKDKNKFSIDEQLEKGIIHEDVSEFSNSNEFINVIENTLKSDKLSVYLSNTDKNDDSLRKNELSLKSNLVKLCKSEVFKLSSDSKGNIPENNFEKVFKRNSSEINNKTHMKYYRKSTYDFKANSLSEIPEGKFKKPNEKIKINTNKFQDDSLTNFNNKINEKKCKLEVINSPCSNVIQTVKKLPIKQLTDEEDPTSNVYKFNSTEIKCKEENLKNLDALGKKEDVATLESTPNKSSPKIRRSKWYIIRSIKNVLSVVYDQKYEKISTASKISKQFLTNDVINKYKEKKNVKNVSRNAFDIAFSNISIVLEFQKLCAIGSPKALVRIKKIIPQSKGFYSRDSTDESHILSKKDRFGRRPLNIACQNGNLDIVKYLIDSGSKLDTEFRQLENQKKSIELITDFPSKFKKNELPIITASRWGHYDIVSYLQGIFDYKVEVILVAYNFSNNNLVRKKLEGYCRGKNYVINNDNKGIFSNQCKCWRKKKSRKNSYLYVE